MSSFEDSQRSYYLSEINRAIPASRTANTPTITNTLGTVDPLLPHFSTNFDPTQFTSTFSSGSDVVKKDMTCRSNSSPSTGMRGAASRTGCGWWYIDNPNLQSVGAYGSRRGPMSPTLDTKYGPGEWIWDLNDAVRREGEKSAKKITSCEAIQYSSFPNMGWCPSTNSAIVTDGKGKPAFPNTPNGNCQGTIITSANQCNPTYVCQGLGSPNDDGSVRIYTQAECNQLNGNWYPGGECLKAEGGSWSWDCRALNPGAPSYSNSDSNTTGTSCVDGNLSPGCLKKIVEGQCNSSGTLAQALDSGYASKDQVANDMNSVLLERNFTLPSGIMNDGKMSQRDAINAVTKLKGWSNDSNYRTAGAANNLCYGSPFDMCAIPTNTTTPFSATCITRLAQAAGWSPNGTAMPSKSMTDWNKLNTWGDVLGQISSWKDLADKPNPKQLEYVKKVYGMSASYPDRCPSVTVGEHCAANAGWQRTVPGAGTFYADEDFPAGASYIVVPARTTAELTNAGGQVQTVVGPNEFNFCSRGGFNDNVKKIVVYLTGFKPAEPYDNGKIYAGGDRVIFQDSTYMLPNAIGGAGYYPGYPNAGWVKQG